MAAITSSIGSPDVAVHALDTATGRELWRVEEHTNHSGSTRPVVGHGLVYVPSGFGKGQTLAIRPGRRGEVLDLLIQLADKSLILAEPSERLAA